MHGLGDTGRPRSHKNRRNPLPLATADVRCRRAGSIPGPVLALCVTASRRGHIRAAGAARVHTPRPGSIPGARPRFIKS